MKKVCKNTHWNTLQQGKHNTK